MADEDLRTAFKVRFQQARSSESESWGLEAADLDGSGSLDWVWILRNRDQTNECIASAKDFLTQLCHFAPPPL